MDKLVSVIVPVYNIEKWLHECVDSIINQSYQKLEIILVNDGATDSCPEICDEYARQDNRVQVIHKENSGPADAINAGLKIAKGEYIYICGGDDYITLGAIEVLVAEAAKGNFDFLFFDGGIIHEVERDWCKDKNEFRVCKNRYDDCSGPEMMKQLIANNEQKSSVCLLFIRRQTLETIGLTFYSGILKEDALFTAFLFLHSNCVRQVAKVLFIRRFRENSITTGKLTVKHFIGHYTNSMEFAKYINSKDLDALRKELAYSHCSHHFIRAIKTYNNLSKADRLTVANKKTELLHMVREMDYFGDTDVRDFYRKTIYHYWDALRLYTAFKRKCVDTVWLRRFVRFIKRKR